MVAHRTLVGSSRSAQLCFRLWWHLSASDTLFCQHRWTEVRTLKLRKERIVVAGTDRLVASWDAGRPA